MLMLSVVLCACGPRSSSASQSSAAAATVEIANEYQATRSLADARAQLQALDVANVNQWLLLTTEEAIGGAEANADTNALVTLTLDLGLRSNAITDYARQYGLQTTAALGSGALDTATTAAVDTAADTAVDAVTANEPLAQAANRVDAVLVPLPTADGAANNAGNTADTSAPPAAEPTVAEEVAVVATATEEPTVEAVEPTAEPTATPDTQPIASASTGINVRSGPGVNYDIAGALGAGENAEIVGKNPAGDWWEIVLPNGRQGWIYGALVSSSGNVDAVAVAVNIPTPPPTPVPVPTEPPAPVEQSPVEEAPVEEAPVEAAPAPGGPDFRVVEKRLWDVVENGGRLDGPSVTCGEKRQLVARVIDAAGNPLNGVAVQAIYGAQEIFITGNQGKGDGAVEFVLGGGQALKVIRDVDNREVSSEEAHGLSTKPWEIPFETLIGGRFCTDEASCQSFVDATGCYGHYSWTVTFQRNY